MPTAEFLGVVSVLEVLTGLYGLTDDDIRGDEFYILCPIHERDGGQHEASCSINLITGYWSCWSCKAGGDLAKLGKILLGKNRKAVVKLLRPDNPSAISASIQSRVRMAKQSQAGMKRRKREAKGRRKLEHFHALQEGPYDALYSRGISEDSIERFGIMYCTEAVFERENDKPFTISDAIAIPLRDEEGETFGWCYRATDRSPWWYQNVRYIYSPGIQLSEIWYGLDTNPGGGIIGVTEGAIDRIWLEQLGLPALACLGSNPKVKRKIRKLTDYDEVRMFVDNDNAGILMTTELGGALTAAGTPVTVVRRKPWMTDSKGQPAKDANAMCPVDVELAWEQAIPYALWKRKVLAMSQ